MTKAGKSNHQKRVSSPKTWPIDRKKLILDLCQK